MFDLLWVNTDLDRRTRWLAGKETAEDKARIKATSKFADVNLSLDQWHELEVNIEGDRMAVVIDGKPVCEFRSEGIAHATNSRLRLSVNQNAWVDDVRIGGLR